MQTPPSAAHQPVPADVARLFDVVGKIGEGTYGVVYLARSRAPQPCLLAVKTFKPGKARAQERRFSSSSVF